MKARDDNDRLRDGDLHDDPFESAVPMPTGTSLHSVESVDANAVEWPVPTALPSDGRVPPFPVRVLPEWLQLWVTETAHATQTPTDLPGVLGLGIVGLGISKRIEARIRSDWIERIALYHVVAAPPGERKSPVFRSARAPLDEWEFDARAEVRPARDRALAQIEVHRKRLQEVSRRASRDRAEMSEVDEAADELRKAEEALPAIPRLSSSDVTAERLPGLVHEQGGRFAVLSAEGGIFDTLAGRYSSRTPNLDFVCKAYDGDAHTEDRVGREGKRIRSPLLTMVLTLQPDVLAELGNQRRMRGQGFLARIAYSIPESPVGKRLADPTPVPHETQYVYDRNVKRLLTLDVPADRDGEALPISIEFSAAARQRLVEFQVALEPRLGSSGDLGCIADWANKLVGRVARLAVVLTVSDRVAEGVGHTTASLAADLVPADAVTRAIELGDYFLAHARKAFGVMRADPSLAHARRVHGWLTRKGLPEVSRRDVCNGVGLKAVEAAEALELLAEHGWVVPVEPAPRSGPGRSPSPHFAVHPALGSTNSTEPQSADLSVESVEGQRPAQDDATEGTGGRS